MDRSGQRRVGKDASPGSRDAVVAAVHAALAAPPPSRAPRWVLLEGPPGRGATAAITRALAAAGDPDGAASAAGANGAGGADGGPGSRSTNSTPGGAGGADETREASGATGADETREAGGATGGDGTRGAGGVRGGLRVVRVDGRAVRHAAPGALEAVVEEVAAAEVVGIDDVQWVPAEVLGALGGARLVVAALRTGVPVVAAAELAFVRARDGTEVVGLAALTEEEVAAVLRGDWFNQLPWLVDQCFALTSGSPLLLRRLLEELRRAGAHPTPDPDDLERAVTAVLPRVARFCDAHFAHCGPAVHALIDAVIVLGDDVPLWLAADAAGLPREEAAEAATALAGSGVLAQEDPLRRAMPLAWQAMAQHRLRLRHDELRRRAARLLARTAGGAAQAADLLLAAPPSGEEWATDVLREAAHAALDAGDSERALRCFERAASEPAADAVRGPLLVELGDARERAGRGDPITPYRQALRVTAGGERPAIHLRLGRSLYGAGDYRGAALELDRGLALAPPDAPVTIELLAAYVASARFDRTLEDAAGRHLTPFLDRPGPADTAAERALLAELALERGIRGMPRTTVVRLALRAWSDGLLLEGADPYGIALSQVAAALTWSDAFADSIAVLTATAAHGERTGEAQLVSTARYLRAWPRYYTGALDEAEADVRSALDAPGWEMYEPSARAILGHVLFERGDHAAATAILALANPEPWERTIPYAMLLEVRARLHAERGDLSAAAADLAQVGALLDTMGNRSPFCPWRSRLGLVSALQGDAAAARDLIATELHDAEAIGTPRAIGMALQARGRVAHLTQQDGVADLEAAAETLEGCGARTEQARTLVALGVALADAGRRDDARARLRTAADLAASIGAREIAERAERELRRAGGRDRDRGAATRPAGLTPSELRVARLAARGLTNREIAEELVVSSHTVRFHLAAVYRKLAVADRTEIGERLSRHDG